MIDRNFIEEDMELQRCAATPQDMKPRFNWADVTSGESQLADRSVFLRSGDQQTSMSASEIAETVGKAITDLALSRKQDEIFTESNRNLVSSIVDAVGRSLNEKFISANGDAILTTEELTDLIERALVRQNAHDVAKSLIIRQKAADARHSVETNATVKPLCRVVRRNGEVVPWNANKIEIAVRSAFLSLGMDSSPAKAVSEALTERVAKSSQEFILIEDLQDVVQEELMRQGHFKVAEAYILYRAHRNGQRSQEEAEAQEVLSGTTQDAMIVVTRRDGSSELWDGLDLRRRIEFASAGLDLSMTTDQIEQELRRAFFSEMTEDDLRKTVTLNAKTLIEKDADFAQFAGRILLTYMYEETLDWNIARDGVASLGERHRRAFKANLVRGVEINRLSPKLLDYNLDKLADAINPASDLDFEFLGIQTLYDRYLIVDKTGSHHQRIETPQLFWMRVAMGLMVEETGDREEKVLDLYRLYSSRRFCSSTPTLFNSGTLHNQLSSCYLYKVDDSIESIMQRGIADNAYLSKWAGGLGGSWTSVRGTGSYIQGTNGESQGVIPFLKLHNDQLVAVNQGGKRRGSGCAYLETWHNDILDFLELRVNTGDERRRAHDMNTANWVPDLFMKRMEARENWTLFRSNEVPDLHDTYGAAFETKYEEYEALAKEGKIFGKEIPAIELWKKMLKMLFETGHPWITFKDPCNVRSPQDHKGVIHSSNLCTEITLNTSADETAVCNLGSVVLDNHIAEDGSLDLDKLKETVTIAVRALDNVIDINFYPTESAKNANSRHRPVGLGVMGLQNALYKRNTPFASSQAVDFNDEFMEAIAYFAYEASSDLAAERGSYSSFEGSKWQRGLLPADTLDLLEEERGMAIDVVRGGRMDWDALRTKIQSQGMRNSNVLAIAPTATISNIMGSTPCIEPTYKNLFVKSNLGGDFIVLNRYLVDDLKAINLWNDDMVERLKYFDGELAEIEEIPQELKDKYATAFGINYDWFIQAAARRQKWIDQAQSVNLFLPTPDLKTLSHMYRAAWHAGLKTTYYLRTLQASNIDTANSQVKRDVRHVGENGAVPAADGTAPAAGTPAVDNSKREYTDEEKAACSLDALLNGGECEACQ